MKCSIQVLSMKYLKWSLPGWWVRELRQIKCVRCKFILSKSRVELRKFCGQIFHSVSGGVRKVVEVKMKVWPRKKLHHQHATPSHRVELIYIIFIWKSLKEYRISIRIFSWVSYGICNMRTSAEKYILYRANSLQNGSASSRLSLIGVIIKSSLCYQKNPNRGPIFHSDIFILSLNLSSLSFSFLHLLTK